MIVGRVIGWIVVLAGGAVLVRDLVVRIDTKHWAPIALGQLWYQLNRSSLNLVQALVNSTPIPFCGTRSSSAFCCPGPSRC
jgi:uncharacterized protein (UPF0212 family)